MEKNAIETIPRNQPVSTAPILGAIPYLLHFPGRRFWVDYDQDADVLYVSFRHPQQATDSEMTDEGVLLRYRRDELVGITVLDVSARSAVRENDESKG